MNILPVEHERTSSAKKTSPGDKVPAFVIITVTLSPGTCR